MPSSTSFTARGRSSRRTSSADASQPKRKQLTADQRSQQAYDEFEADLKQIAGKVGGKVGAFFSKAKPTSATAKRDDRRRARNKKRAGKLFAENYAESPSETSEGAPRAALYKGEMGAKQRKSSRMQKASQAGSSSAKFDPRGWFSNFSLKGFPVKTVTALVCIVLAFVFLYTPAQQYYQSARERDRLAAEYAAIEDRNVALQYQNVALASDAGMEDAVRQTYGYVKPGEQVARVSGLSDEATDSARGSENIEANVLSSSVKAPEEWYTPFLDAFFGVK